MLRKRRPKAKAMAIRRTTRGRPTHIMPCCAPIVVHVGVICRIPPSHVVRIALVGADRLDFGIFIIRILFALIQADFPDIAEHIVKPISIGPQKPDRHCPNRGIERRPCNVCDRFIEIALLAGIKRSASSGAAGKLPLCGRRQVETDAGQRTHLVKPTV